MIIGKKRLNQDDIHPALI